MRLKTFAIAVIASGAMAVGAQAASAQTALQNGYSEPGGVVQTQVDNGNPQRTPEAATSTSTPAQTANAPATKTQASSNGSLPFTGLDVGLVLIAAGMLLATGFGIRRLSRSTAV